MNIRALPQVLMGNELVTIHQKQNGEWIKCSMPLSMLASLVIGEFIGNLPVDKPDTSGIAWNNAGVVSVS